MQWCFQTMVYDHCVGDLFIHVEVGLSDKFPLSLYLSILGTRLCRLCLSLVEMFGPTGIVVIKM